MGVMSEEQPPYKKAPGPGELSDLDRMKRAIMVYKNWIWTDKRDIAELFGRLSALEKDHQELKAYIDRILTRTEN